MTGKRFVLEEFGLNFIVNDNGRQLSARQTVDLLNQLSEENEQLKFELDTHKHPLWSTREAEQKVNELTELLMNETKKNAMDMG